MKRFTHAELAAAHDRQDWALLWRQAVPLVKLTVGRMARMGAIHRENADDDLLQEGMLIAGQAIRTWRALECAFSTHIVNQIRWGVFEFLGKRRNHGIGSHVQRPAVLSLGDSRDGLLGADAEGNQGEDEDDGTFEAALTYEGILRPSGQYDGMGAAPEGLGDPVEEADRDRKEVDVRAAVSELPFFLRDVIQAVMGFNGTPETLRDYAARIGLSYGTAHRRYAGALTTLDQKIPNSHHNKYGSKENVRDTQQR